MTDIRPALCILGIDTSCDDTGVGLVELAPDGSVSVLANRVWSQTVHAGYGGVMPELASREHVERIDAVMDDALREAGVGVQDISAVAATSGPGLVGALLVGLMYGKGLAQGLGIPFHATHHLEGHIYAAASETQLAPPYLALVVSGGHTHLFDVPNVGEYVLVGATRDDAAGEAFDKVARLSGPGLPRRPCRQRGGQAGRPQSRPIQSAAGRAERLRVQFQRVEDGGAAGTQGGRKAGRPRGQFSGGGGQESGADERAGGPRPGATNAGGVGRRGGEFRPARSVCRHRTEAWSFPARA